MESKFRIAEVNALPAETLASVFGECLAVHRWARTLAADRPYPDVPALLARADELSASLTGAELRAALDDHPRIGTRPAAGSRPAAEQSGVDSERLAGRLAEANAAYEERFGHIYLVCAAGRDGEDLLADLARRMTNDPATEWGVVRDELGKIARLRLSGMIEA
ncbi:MAG TPA: 2-oxo-4-hydroxy-4-carboxy-5-ureidoimidazoline decarboxylase [Pseudonocardiaceae bacterium]|jgi:2-oxo-4-hydroxy-4-carboxy-5-ureidoimidazoline decarboxylase|nr:2-oxo-4-hydroxy-4-carboxy-5-ureidoimidazoline decarboxylase [Pseudonocardiaceae bacterium]